jgi:hypothetical protein
MSRENPNKLVMTVTFTRLDDGALDVQMESDDPCVRKMVGEAVAVAMDAMGKALKEWCEAKGGRREVLASETTFVKLPPRESRN